MLAPKLHDKLRLRNVIPLGTFHFLKPRFRKISQDAILLESLETEKLRIT